LEEKTRWFDEQAKHAIQEIPQNPHDHHLALEIKKIGDEVANCTDKMRVSERKSK
jgi:hypothetical protein